MPPVASEQGPEDGQPNNRLPPIFGYGDYSGADAFEVDARDVVADVVRCLNDHGIPAEADGMFVAFDAVPAEQIERAEDLSDACFAGLNLPPLREPTRAEYEKLYARQLAVAECLESLGFPSLTGPPSLEVWIDSYATGPWGAYDALVAGEIPADAYDRAVRECPEHPPGGYGSWQTGDPVKPAGDP